MPTGLLEDDTKRNFLSKLNCLITNPKSSFQNSIKSDLKDVRVAMNIEKIYFEDPMISTNDKRDRLLYLFIGDLLAGLNGKIINMKSIREKKLDKKKIRPLPKFLKFIGCLIYAALISGMLFYVFLFAVQQPKNMQRSWFISFVMWIIFEVIVVSSGVVFIMHVLIPTLTVNEVEVAKNKLAMNLVRFKDSLRNGVHDVCAKEVFNSSKYMFLSHKMALLFPEYPESQVIMSFQTDMPKIKKVNDDDKSYKKSYKYFFLQLGIYLIINYDFYVLICFCSEKYFSCHNQQLYLAAFYFARFCC